MNSTTEETEQETVIVSNQIECLKCGDKPFSAHRHDFKYCKCKAVAVDGGTSYLRRIGNPSDRKELSLEVPKTVIDSLIKDIQESIDTRRNARGVAYAALRSLRDSHLANK
jgi:hypothetical protein